MPRATSDSHLKPQRWSLTVVLAAFLLGYQPIGVHCLDNVVAPGPLATQLDRPHRQLQTYTSGVTVQSLLLDAVNKERAKVNVAAVCGNVKLLAAADLHSKDQAQHSFMSHTGSNNSTMVQRIAAQGFQWSALGENVAAGYATVDAVMVGWMNSEGHKANILNPNYKFFGGGYAYNATSSYKHYWTQDFGAGATEACSSTPTPTPTPTPTQSSSRRPRSGQAKRQSEPESGEVVALNGDCRSDTDGPLPCIAGTYCQPWTKVKYECIAVAEGSGVPEVNVDYFGDDLEQVRDVSPHQCAAKCIKLSGCVAYTFINTNNDGRTACYLKSGTGIGTELIGAISAKITS